MKRIGVLGLLVVGAGVLTPAQVFGPAVSYTTGQKPVRVQIADVDGRLGPDLAVANANDGTISLFLGKGDGTFETGSVAASVDSPETLLVVDLDGADGPDLVTTNRGGGSGTPQLVVLLNDGTGGFTKTTINTLYFGSDLASADFDRDGDVDIVTANENDDNISVFLGDGSGGLTASSNPSVGDNPVAVIAVDLDGSNGPDIAVAHVGASDGVTVLLNGGGASFPTATDYPVTSGGNPLDLAAGDLDGALGADLVTANSITGDVSVLLSSGSGLFAAATSYAVPGAGFPATLGLADLDGDQDLDLAVGLRSGRSVSVLLGDGTGTFAADGSSPYSVPLDTMELQLSDVDFDNAPEAVVVTADQSDPSLTGFVSVLTNLLGPWGPVVTTSALPNGALGSTYSTTLTASGGTPPYTWDLASGSLPSGLTLRSQSGIIDGTPDFAAVGTTYFTVRVRDAAFDTGIRPLYIEVDSPAAVLVAKGAGSGSSYDQVVAGYEVDGSPISALDFRAHAFPGYGARLGAANLDGGAFEEILVTPGPGPSHPPAVAAFDRTGTPLTLVQFLAYGTNAYGANATGGDLDDLEEEEIVTGPGPGAIFGPQVRGWSYDGSSAPTAMARVNFYAYGTLRFGVNADVSDLDGDGYGELLTGAGPGAVFGPHVRGFDYDGTSVSSLAGLSFFAYGTLKYGVNAAGAELDGDASEELLTGAGPGSVFSTHVRGFDYAGTVSGISNLNAILLSGSYLYGANVASGDLEVDGFDELLIGPGPDPSAPSQLIAFDYDGSGLSRITALDLDPFGLSYGLRTGSAVAGY